MEFVLIPAGSFTMGEDNNFSKFVFSLFGDAKDNTPRHRVTISKPFYLGKYEVTQAQWTVVMGDNPSAYKGRNNPVEKVCWDDVQIFIGHLNQLEEHSRYRLPTEAEWEYAARAGTTDAYSFGNDEDSLGRYAWYDGNSRAESPQSVGMKEPNAWGLYDMHGNVCEWVQDWYEERYYSHSPDSDPQGPRSGSARVVRGGDWGSSAMACRSAWRIYASPDNRDNIGVGFRLALSPGQ
jgi:formylglycine-generating enzyme required for sulfatase activity